MSTDDITEMYVHTATVETYEGTNGYGEDMFAAPVDRPGLLEDGDRLTRGSSSVEDAVEAVFYTAPENADLFLAESKVTANGASSRVVRTVVFTSGDLDLPDHAVVYLGTTRSR